MPLGPISRSSPISEERVSSRLRSISRCCDELEKMRANFVSYPDEKVSVQVGECDWLEELHRLLYGD